MYDISCYIFSKDPVAIRGTTINVGGNFLEQRNGVRPTLDNITMAEAATAGAL